MTRLLPPRIRRPGLPPCLAVAAPLALASVSPSPTLALVAVLVAVATAAVVGPANAVGAVAATLPLVFVTVELGSTEWSVLELALVACGVSCAPELALRLYRRGRLTELTRLLMPLDLTLIAVGLVALAGLSLSWVADPRASVDSQRELRRVILEPLVVLLAVRLSPVTECRRLVVTFLSLSGVAVAIVALVQMATRSSGVEVGSVFRPIGTYLHPNNLALFLERVVWLPLAAVPLAHDRRLAWGATGIIAVGCLATLSRGAAVALVVGAIVWLVLTRRRPPLRWGALGVGAIVVAVAIARAGGDGTESVDARATIWQSAWRMIEDYPVTGIGLDQFFQLYGTRYVDPSGWSERYTSHPHNIVLDFWLRLGLPGLALLAALVAVSVRRGFAARRAIADPAAAGLLAGLAAGFAHGLIDNGFFLADLATYTWLALALAALPAPDSERP